MGNGPAVTPTVLRYLHAHIGETVFLKDIAVATKFTERQVQNSILHMVNNGVEWVEVVSRGQAWRYHGPMPEVAPEPAQKKEPRLFDEVGVTRDGTLIIADLDNNLYRAEPL